MQISSQPIIRQQLNAFRDADKDDLLKFKLSIRRENKGDLSHFVFDMLVWVFQELLNCWDFATQPSLTFREKEKISREQQFFGWKSLVDIRGQRKMARLLQPGSFFGTHSTSGALFQMPQPTWVLLLTMKLHCYVPCHKAQIIWNWFLENENESTVFDPVKHL